MALIRQANAARASRDAIVLDLGDLMRQGEAVKARAREEAARIVAEAKAERDRLVSGAAERGHKEGYGRGLEEGRIEGQADGREAAIIEFRDRLNKIETVWIAALRKFEQDRDAMMLSARQDILALAVAMGEAVTRRKIEIDPEVVVSQLTALLERVTAPTRLTIRIHPDDRATLERVVAGIMDRFGRSPQVDIVDAPELDRGSVVATTDSGCGVDASIRTQLDRIVQVLLPQPPGASG